MNKRARVLIALLLLPAVVTGGLAVSLPGSGVPAASAQGANLITNPSFEDPYFTVGIYENMRVAHGWAAWWQEGSLEEIVQGYKMRPEYKAAFTTDAPFDRVHSGALAQQYFHSFGNFIGGVFQGVHGVRVGQRLRFTIWGMAWSCEDWSACHTDNPPRTWSYRPSPMRMRIGIDPTGGSDPWSANVVWSPEKDSYDAWSQWTVEAVAASTTVTVWTYAYPEYRTQSNDVYWDDAELIVVGTGSPPRTATPRPGATVPSPSGTPLPQGAGERLYTVVAGDTLSAIGLRFGVSWLAIARRNSLGNPNLIFVGQKLIIPAP
jgi:LysM repeat protein